VGELIGDKLPQTPSRLAPAGYISRLTLGAVSGAILARRAGRAGIPTVIAGAFGAAGAAVGTRSGAAWRARSTEIFERDLPGAVIEDIVAIFAAKVALSGVPIRRAGRQRAAVRRQLAQIGIRFRGSC
jgi:uncharacterized membrane protein